MTCYRCGQHSMVALMTLIHRHLGASELWIGVRLCREEPRCARVLTRLPAQPSTPLLPTQRTDFFLHSVTIGGSHFELDWFAVGLTLLLTSLVARGAKESTTVNTVLTVIHVLIMAFIIIAGFCKADTAK